MNQGYFTIKQNENKHFIKYNLFENKQEYKCYKNTNTTQGVCEPLSEPMMQESL